MSLKYRRLDNNGDYVFGHGNSDFLKDGDAVLQAVQTRLLLLKGEWWEDITNGTDLFDGIIEQRPTESGKNIVDIIVKERVLSVNGVSSITSFKSAINSEARTYTANLVIDTIYGEVEENIILGGNNGI